MKRIPVRWGLVGTGDIAHKRIEDHATAVLSFTEPNGRILGLTGTITASHCLDIGEDQFEIYGTEGKLISPDLGRGELRVVTRKGSKSLRLRPPANLHLPLIKDFNRAVLENREPLVSGDEGAKTSRVLDQIYGRI